MTVYAVREGGLGNQLFQLAAAIGLAPDGDGRLLRPVHRFLLDIEDVAPKLVPRIVRDDLRMVRSIPPSLRYRQAIRELHGAFAPRPNFSRRPHLIEGYFQHPDWYTAALPRIVDGLLDAAPRGFAAAPDRPPVVNVRGGDYAHHGWLLPASYYVRAAQAAAIDEAITISDDAAHGELIAATLTAAGRPAAPPQPSMPISDFWALAATPTVVMANSTFTWWAMHVGDELYRRAGLTRTVVFPSEWLKGAGVDLCDPGWLAI